MKIRSIFELDKKEMNIDWRRTVMSFIKTALKKEVPELYEEFYGEGKVTVKPYTYWTVLPGAKFKEDLIILDKNEFTFFLSTNDVKIAMYFLNAFLSLKNKRMPLADKNYMRLKELKTIKEKPIIENEIIINMLSPMVVRQHYRDRPDKYILYNEQGFYKVFGQSVLAQIGYNDQLPEIEPIKCKKVIVKAFGGKIPASLGIFKLRGDKKVLNKLYMNGIGSKSSAGFGKFEILS